MTNLNKLQAPFEPFNCYGIALDVFFMRAIIMNIKIFDLEMLLTKLSLKTENNSFIIKHYSAYNLGNLGLSYIESKKFANELYKENVKIYDVCKLK